MNESETREEELGLCISSIIEKTNYTYRPQKPTDEERISWELADVKLIRSLMSLLPMIIELAKLSQRYRCDGRTVGYTLRIDIEYDPVDHNSLRHEILGNTCDAKE